MSGFSKFYTWLFVLGSLLIAAGLAMAQEGPTRVIEHVAGDLYRFQNNAHYGVFFVTDEGVVLVDPINAGTAEWVKAEIKSRFDRDVIYVIYSHDHADHTSGGEVFAETAIFISHINAARKIEASGRSTVPDVVFDNHLGMNVGGKEVWLYFPGKSHSDNLIVVHFPAERALFVVDVAAVRRLPYQSFGDYYFPDTLEALTVIEQIDFDILVPGHGSLGVRQDLLDHHSYLAELYQQVVTALEEGLDLEQAKGRITMSDYRHWGQYEQWLPLNVEGLYRILSAP